MHEHHEDTEPRPEPEPTEAEYRSLTRSLAQDVGTLAVAGGVTGFTFTTGKLAAEGAAAKVKGALTPKPSEIELPPGTDK